MAGTLDLIDTIIVLILENRSFDHVLGYLSRGAGGLPVDGIRDDPAWLAQHANSWNGATYPPHPISRMAIVDPPHGSRAIADQIGRPPAGSTTPPMDGFVKAYANSNPTPDDVSLVMGHYTAAEVPMSDFLARNYAVCDHWFAALPAGTQPNKLMAMSGTTPLVDNAAVLLPDQPLVYDWLTDHGVRWCVYQSGDFFPFFTLMPSWQGEIATSLALGTGGHFRRLNHFPEDWKTAALPPVIFIEPEYSDGFYDSPNDDHPPTAISRGQILLHDIYAALIANPARWSRTMWIITYDEHGGFYDHVPPLPIVTDVKTTTGFLVRLATSGLRVPALVVSPLVEAGAVHGQPLDHTSILQLLADKFDGGRPYSDAVAQRQPFLTPLSAVLTRAAPRPPAPPAPLFAPAPEPAGAAAQSPPTPSAADNARAMQLAGERMIADHPELAGRGLERIAAATRGGGSRKL